MAEQGCEHAGYSHGRGRVYCRSFNWQEARERHDAGESISALAREYGVAWLTMKRALDPEWRKTFDAKSAAWKRGGKWPDCGAQTTRHQAGGGYRCRTCAAAALTTTVRANELRCARCREWKPDSAFPLNRSEEKHRGRHRNCRRCLTIVKAEWRARRRAAGKPAP